MKSYLFIFIIALGFLTVSCGGGGGGSTTPTDTTTNSIEGVWAITETSKDGNCAVPAPKETFDLTVTQNGNSITIVDEDSNSFTGTLSGQNLSWSGSYSDAAPDGTPGTTTLNSMSAIIDASCNSLSGSANWTWTATDGSGYSCSGTTTFTGSRTPASGCGIPDDPTDPTDPTPSIAGFNFSLSQGDYWDYAWDRYYSEVYSGGGSSGTTKGVFRIKLGEPTVIGNITAFPLITSGNNRDFVTPRWTHIAMEDNKIMLSSDGVDFKPVFDANTGFVVGFGFFEVLSDTNLFEITAGSISNDYITATDSVYALSDSAGASRCEYFPEYGTICGADEIADYTIDRKEYYQADIGAIGYYYNSTFSTGGTFDSYHTSTRINIGLVASSRRGDVVDYDFETEPNNTPATATLITNTVFPVTVKGDMNYQADIDVTLPENYATNYRYYVNARDEVEPNNSLATAETVIINESIQGAISSSDFGEFKSFTAGGNSINTSIEDWYSFVVTTEMANQYAGTFPFDVDLEFYDAGLVDIDLFLFNSSGGLVIYSIATNSGANGSTNFESIRPDIAAGTYYIGVDIWPASDSSERNGNYTMSVTQTNISSDPGVENGYWIADFYKLNISAATSLSLNASPSLAIFVTNQDGTNVVASARPTTDPLTAPTILVTPILQPGVYLIALGYSGAVDTYELTITTNPINAGAN